MKKIVLILLLALYAYGGSAQVVIPVIEGKFGVDADAQSNIFIDATSPCSDCDDWWYDELLSGGNGLFVIDTTGAGAIVKGYLTNPAATNNVPFYRKMRYQAFEQIDERTLIDAIFVRDYHGTDQTAFVDGSNKNADHPTDWRGATKSVLDKNDILDVYCHIRRVGPNYNTTDPLWLFGAVAVEGTNGDRYFDFEMYQTDIFYTRSTSRFTGYGPDAGHTSWKFDAAGNVTQPGDIIFAANFSTSGLTDIEARIWINKADKSKIPATFDWTGTFDGASASATYGYAGIRPKYGDPFYYGTLNADPTWAGPYMLPRANGLVVSQFEPGQFMEFGVNLTALGLNPSSLLGKTPCGIPFSKVMVKTRSSTSFTSELKDFIAPFDLFLPPMANLAADVPMICGSTAPNSTIWVTDPYSTSTYNWTTPNGHIVSNLGDSIIVDSAGTYIVNQILDAGCPLYSADTVLIAYDPSCVVLSNNRINLNGLMNNGLVNLDWTVTANDKIKYFTIERSFDGIHFNKTATVDAVNNQPAGGYKATDELFGINASNAYYRIKGNGINGEVLYSTTVKISLSANGISTVTVVPNPVRNTMQINISSNADKDVQVLIYDVTGKLMQTTSNHVQKGYSTIKMNGFDSWARGVYTIKVLSGNDVFMNRMLLTK